MKSRQVRPKTGSGSCEHCGQVFVFDPTRNPGRPRRFCSVSCGSRFTQAKARQEALAAPPVDKVCTKCGEAKPLTEYSTNPKTGKPWNSYCKACGPTVHHGLYAVRTKEQRDRYNRARREVKDALKKSNPAILRTRYRKENLSKYGLTIAAFDALLAAQNGLCAICERPWGENFYDGVDHDHATGKVRGLLCFMCNQGLGRFKDDPELLKTAIKYLEMHK